MIVKATIAIGAILASSLIGWTDASARGGAGGFHGGVGAFGHGGFIGAARSGSDLGRMGLQGFGFGAHRGQHDSMQHGAGDHDGRPKEGRRDERGDNRDRRADEDRRGERANAGHWQRSVAFGAMARQGSRFDNEWHRASGFGDTGRQGSHLDGEWQADREP